jgi:hypothetical protein
LPAGVREHGVGDAGVVLARSLVDELVSLEPVEQPRHSRRCEQQPVGEVDTAQLAVRFAGEMQERLVVVDREAVLGEQPRLQRPSQ